MTGVQTCALPISTCCVSMDEACMVFQEIDVKNAVSWTTLITGYTHRGDGYGGLRVFRQMLLVSKLLKQPQIL